MCGYSDIECSRNYGLERTHLVLRRDASRGDLRRPGRMARIPSDVTYAAILLRCDHAQGLIGWHRPKTDSPCALAAGPHGRAEIRNGASG